MVGALTAFIRFNHEFSEMIYPSGYWEFIRLVPFTSLSMRV